MGKKAKDKEAEVEEREASEDKPRATARRRVRCPVCEGHGVQLENQGGATCKCESCGVLFLNPRPSVGEFLKKRNKRFDGAITANHSLVRRSEAQDAIEAMKGYHFLVSGKSAPLNAFGKRVLDVGCGLGFRLFEFEKYGWTVIGLEPSVNARAYTQAMMLNVIENDFPACASESRAGRESIRVGPFDLILVEDVIEEVTEPRGLVASIKESLSPGGVACVSVPLREDDEPESVPEGRLYLFNEDALRKLFMQAGFAEPHVKAEEKLRLWFKKRR